MQASHINAQQGSLLLILGTTMQFGYGPGQNLCTVHAQRMHGMRTARNTPPQSSTDRCCFMGCLACLCKLEALEGSGGGCFRRGQERSHERRLATPTIHSRSHSSLQVIRLERASGMRLRKGLDKAVDT